MTEPKIGVVSGDVSPEEIKKRGESAVLSLVDNIVRKERDSWWESVADMLARHEVVDRTSVPETQNRKGEAVTRLSSPTEPLYRRMSDEEREWRNPDSDHWMAEWLRGHVYGDRGQKLQANAKLVEMFGRADVTEGVADASGGFATGTGAELLPRPLENVVFIARDRVAKMRRFATNYPMTSQEHNIPTQAAMTAAMVAEGSTAAQGEGAVAQVPLIARKAQVKAVATREILADAAVSLVNIFARRGGGALGVLEDNQFFRLGDGTAPNVTKISGTAYNETTSGTIQYSELLTMYYNVAQEYRDNSVWFIAANVLNLMSNLRDGNGRPLFQGLTDVPGPISDDPSAVGTVFRRPVYEVPFSDGEIWFGDPAAVYAVGTRQGIEVRASEHVNFASDEVMWLITERFAGNNVDTVAAQVCQGITAVTST